MRGWIESHGPMTFDRFMAMALYESGLGYYATLSANASDMAGALADFQTSPQVHPAFGQLIARYLRQVWEALDRPEPFVVVEPGAGEGELARQIRDGLSENDGPGLVVYHAVDARRGSEEGTLRWWGSLDAVREAGIKAHCVVSNEFFDALPVHRVAWLDGRLREIYVDWGENWFVERLGDLSDEALGRWIIDGGIVPPEGWRGEICLRLAPTIETLAALVERGVILSIDYGYQTAELFDPARVGGTLLAYHRHQWNDELFERVGEQDLTSHVDFGALARLGRRWSLEPVFGTTQRNFLLRLGLADEVERRVASALTPGKRWQTRLNLSELVRPDGLGRLKVLAQARGLDRARLAGLAAFEIEARDQDVERSRLADERPASSPKGAWLG